LLTYIYVYKTFATIDPASVATRREKEREREREKKERGRHNCKGSPMALLHIIRVNRCSYQPRSVLLLCQRLLKRFTDAQRQMVTLGTSDSG
jgi:hypothetical protein